MLWYSYKYSIFANGMDKEGAGAPSFFYQPYKLLYDRQNGTN